MRAFLLFLGTNARVDGWEDKRRTRADASDFFAHHGLSPLPEFTQIRPTANARLVTEKDCEAWGAGKGRKSKWVEYFLKKIIIPTCPLFVLVIRKVGVLFSQFESWWQLGCQVTCRVGVHHGHCVGGVVRELRGNLKVAVFSWSASAKVQVDARNNQNYLEGWHQWLEWLKSMVIWNGVSWIHERRNLRELKWCWYAYSSYSVRYLHFWENILINRSFT